MEYGIYCPCGKKLKNTKDYFYKIVHYNRKGQMIFAMCIHNKIVIDKEKE